MKKISMIFLILLMGAFSLNASNVELNKAQNLQIFSADNSDGKIDAKTIQKAFDASGVVVDVNNNMNSIFEKRYGSVHHKKYNLAIFTNNELVLKLMKKYPKIGLITPLSMSIYMDGATNSINISTLSLHGMARITEIPQSDADLRSYAKLVDIALHKALPNGKYLALNHNTKAPKESLISEFEMELELEDGATYMDAKEEFEEEFESELGPVGFLIPKSYKLQHEDYDFFDTYSIIRFNAIYPVSKNHPDAGAYAPFSLVIYKKKDEDSLHIAYPSIDNWISDLDIKDKKTVQTVQQTQNMIKNILQELTE